MKKNVDEQDFIQEFASYNRSDQFSRNALRLLYNHLIEWEEAAGQEEELDVIDLCGRYTELSLLQFAKDYDLDVKDWVNLEDYEDEDEFNNDNYLKLISDILTSDCPEEYKNHKILSDILVRTRDNDDEYYKILLTGLYVDDDWIETSAIYFVTDTEYKFIGTTKTTSDAIDMGNALPSDIFNLTIEDKKDKITCWEDVNESELKRAIAAFIYEKGDFVAFTNHGTVIFGDM